MHILVLVCQIKMKRLFTEQYLVEIIMKHPLQCQHDCMKNIESFTWRVDTQPRKKLIETFLQAWLSSLIGKIFSRNLAPFEFFILISRITAFAKGYSMHAHTNKVANVQTFICSKTSSIVNARFLLRDKHAKLLLLWH